MYTNEKNALIVLSLLKAHGIRYIVASPGTTNIAFVASAQVDPYFKIFSAVDERHAAYVACGIAEQSLEPVVISCTGATASRNYFSALTEAFYRKLPILAITSMQNFHNAGRLSAQWLNRDSQPSDTVRMSVSCPWVETDEDYRMCEVVINKAILELTHHGGGPVHINLETHLGGEFVVDRLPSVRKISRVTVDTKDWPTLKSEKVLVWITSHKRFSASTERAISEFSRNNDAVVLVDHTSSYSGENSVCASLLLAQKGVGSNPKFQELKPDLIIHIGGVSGDYSTKNYLSGLAPVWRVCEDGDVVDTLGGLQNVFEMNEEKFFSHYSNAESKKSTYFDQWKEAVSDLRQRIPEMPFSSLWIAGKFGCAVPEKSIVHAAILSSLRSLNFQHEPMSCDSMCNVGGFGIDGCVSSLIGASFVAEKKKCFIMVGDMAFFYDMNALGNRHITNNLRILLINNGLSGEMYMPISIGAKLGEQARPFVCSEGHFGNQSKVLVKDYAKDLGFKYLSAENKDEFLSAIHEFVEDSPKPIVFECFTSVSDDAEALRIMMEIETYKHPRSIKSLVPSKVKNVIKAAIS